MKKWHRHLAVALAAGITATAVFAEDWPQWRGPNRDGKVTGFTAPAAWPKALAEKWRQKVGDGDSTPALVGDRLYVFTRQDANEVLTCLNAADGKEIWHKSYPATAMVTGAAAQHPGPRSSPAVADGKVITLGVVGILTCWDASSGNILWQKTEPKGYPGFFTASSPMIVDGLVIAQLGGHGPGGMGGGGGGRRGGPGGGGQGGGRGTPPPIQQEQPQRGGPGRGGPPGDRPGPGGAGGGTGGIMAFDINTGNEKWKWTGDSPSYSSPIVATIADVKQIVAPTEHSIVAVSITDGKQLWQVPSQPQRMTYNAPTPIVDGDNVIITGYGGGTKAIKVSKQGDVFSTAEAWNNSELGTTFNTPVLRDGYLYGLSSQGALFCLNAKDGKTAWTGPQPGGGGGGGGRGMGRANFGGIVDAGSVLIALPSNSEMIVFKPNEKAYEELARINVSKGHTYAYPVLSGNKVIVKDEQSVAMLAIE